MTAAAVVILLATVAFFALCAAVEAVALWLGWLDYGDEDES